MRGGKCSSRVLLWVGANVVAGTYDCDVQPDTCDCALPQSNGDYWDKCCRYDCGSIWCSWTGLSCEQRNKETSYQCAGEESLSLLTFQNKDNEPDVERYGSTVSSRVVPDTEWCTRSSDCDPFVDTAQRGCCLVAVDTSRKPLVQDYAWVTERRVLGCVCEQSAAWFEYSSPYSGAHGCQTTLEANQVNMPLCDCAADSTQNNFGACVSESGEPRFFSSCEPSDDPHCDSNYPGGCIKCTMDRLTLRLYMGGGAGSAKWCWAEPDPVQQDTGCAGGRYDELARSTRSLPEHLLNHDGCSWQWDGCSSTSCWRYFDKNDEIPGGCSCFANGCSENNPDSSLGFCSHDSCEWKSAAECNGFGMASPPGCACQCQEPLAGPGCTLSDVDWCSQEGTIASLRNFPSYRAEADIVFCHCKPGFVGQKCERRGCRADDDCLNGGVCALSTECANNGTECWQPTDGLCSCPDTHYGTWCELPWECTRRAYCNGNGECAVSSDGTQLTCDCDYSFGGDRCELAEQYSCDPTVGPEASSDCQGMAYCMDSENCDLSSFDPILQEYVATRHTHQTCERACTCAWREQSVDCALLPECTWSEERGACTRDICTEIAQIASPYARQRRCEREAVCMYTQDAECVERLFGADRADVHVCTVTEHGTCRDSRTEKEYTCSAGNSTTTTVSAEADDSEDSCFRVPERVVRDNDGWTDFRLVFRGATREDTGNRAELSIREVLLLDENGASVGPWFAADGEALNNWTVYCNRPHDATVPHSECWRMFDRDYLADTTFPKLQTPPPPNRTAPSAAYGSADIKACLDHWGEYTLDTCYDCRGAVACVPVMRDGVSPYTFEGTPFGYGACSLSALGKVDAWGDYRTGPSFVACLVDDQGYTAYYDPNYYYGCYGAYDYYTWRLDPAQQARWTQQQCSAGAFRTAPQPHDEGQFSNGAVTATFRVLAGSSVAPASVRVLCDTENLHAPSSRSCPNRVELQARQGPGTQWVTVYDSKSTRKLSAHRAQGMGRLLTQADFVFTVPSTTAPLDITQQGFAVSLDVADTAPRVIPSRTYRYDSIQVLHFTADDVLVPETTPWAYRLWEGCIGRDVIIDRRRSGSSCVSEAAFLDQCMQPPCCRDNRCCAQFGFAPSPCGDEPWENWCRGRSERQMQLDALAGIPSTIANTSTACATTEFESQRICTPQPVCECQQGWQKPPGRLADALDCSQCVDPCEHGTCDISTGGECQCDAGWNGRSCEHCYDEELCYSGVLVHESADAGHYTPLILTLVLLTLLNWRILCICMDN